MFQNQLLGEWPEPTEEEKLAYKAAQEYFARCDSYDKLICGPIGMPRNGEELALINRNSKEIREELVLKYKISAENLKEAIKMMLKS